jgi:glycine/D-amino acid oxidase-like deaminating enzyme
MKMHSGLTKYNPRRSTLFAVLKFIEASQMTCAAANVAIPIGKRAVVIGAGMSGLPAARALSDHFEEVIVLERDSLPAEATPRPGTPQSRHLHGLLGGGQRALGALFPGFELDLARAGAVTLRAGLDLRYERKGYDPSTVRA